MLSFENFRFQSRVQVLEDIFVPYNVNFICICNKYSEIVPIFGG